MKIRYLLYPFSLVFGFVAALRRFFYKKRLFSTADFPLPVICVGNLKTGGTGKTPHVEYLVRLLEAKYNIALLSRGYGRKTKGFILAGDLLPDEKTASCIGDEPAQIARKHPFLKLAVSEKRKIGMENLLMRYPDLEAVLLDDAFQHLAVNPSFKIVLTEYADPYFKDCPLPAGNLREFAVAAKEADMIIVSKAPASLTVQEKEAFVGQLKLQPGQSCFFSTYQYSTPFPGNERARSKIEEKLSKVVLITGIANPHPLKDHLSAHFEIIHHWVFPDHHRYTREDERKILKKLSKQDQEKLVIMTTEKDYTRLLAPEMENIISRYPVFVIPVQVKILFEEENKFNTIIEDHVRKSKKSRRFLE